MGFHKHDYKDLHVKHLQVCLAFGPRRAGLC